MKNLRYVWAFWSNFQWVKWTNTFNSIKKTQCITIYLSLIKTKNLGHYRAQKRSPSDSTLKTEEKAPIFISVKCHFGSKKGKRIFLKKGSESNPI